MATRPPVPATVSRRLILVRKLRPDLILMDIQLPQVSASK